MYDIKHTSHRNTDTCPTHRCVSQLKHAVLVLLTEAVNNYVQAITLRVGSIEAGVQALWGCHSHSLVAKMIKEDSVNTSLPIKALCVKKMGKLLGSL